MKMNDSLIMNFSECSFEKVSSNVFDLEEFISVEQFSNPFLFAFIDLTVVGGDILIADAS